MTAVSSKFAVDMCGRVLQSLGQRRVNRAAGLDGPETLQGPRGEAGL